MISATARVRLSLLALAAVLCVLAAMAPEPAGAAPMTFTVNQSDDLVDDGDGTCDVTCTMRDAMLAANANPGNDTIDFDPANSPYLIVPWTDLPAILATDGITITGEGSDVEIVGYEMQTSGPGLFFYTPSPGMVLRDVVVRDLTVSQFESGTGIKFCGGAINGTTCPYHISNVELRNLTLEMIPAPNGALEMRAAQISDLTIADSTFTDSPFNIQGSDDITDVSMTDLNISTASLNYSEIRSTQDLNDVSVLRMTTNIQIGIKGTNISGLTMTGSQFTGDKAPIFAQSLQDLTDVEISGNSFADAISLGGSGLIANVNVSDNMLPSGRIVIGSGASTNTRIERNTIVDSDVAGILVAFSGGSSNVVRDNVIRNSATDGIRVIGNGPVTISRNIIDSNMQLAIDLVKPGEADPGVTLNDADDGDTGPNGLLNFPVITGDSPQGVSGTACANCKVELFSAYLNDPTGYGEAPQFLVDGVANQAGQFFISTCELAGLSDIPISATATDGQGNTSELALNYVLTAVAAPCPTATPPPTVAPTPTPTPTAMPTATPPTQRKQGDLDCDEQVDARDALLPVLLTADVEVETPTGCVDLGEGDPPFGSVNCDEAVDLPDTIAILQYVAEVALTPSQPVGCTPMGEDLPT